MLLLMALAYNLEATPSQAVRQNFLKQRTCKFFENIRIYRFHSYNQLIFLGLKRAAPPKDGDSRFTLDRI
ncbi:hypothetical protein ASF12_06425 [Paenibacillus sp. Leaf72]|nr:hypothetical protein ASF12_06425 [Paenibacillus sp. Leaf72]